MGFKSGLGAVLAVTVALGASATSMAGEAPLTATEKLTDACYAEWQTKGWKVRGQDQLADNNPAFRNGIRNVCQARAELYMEGYEIRPFIKDDSQRDVYPLIFSSDVEAIKSHLKTFIKPLQLI